MAIETFPRVNVHLNFIYTPNMRNITYEEAIMGRYEFILWIKIDWEGTTCTSANRSRIIKEISVINEQ